MESKMVNISGAEVVTVISTLKEIDVRGFDSMDKLVGLVMFFEKKLRSNQTEQMAEVVNNGTN